MVDVQKKMAKGAAWMVLFKLAERSIGLVSTVFLARLLMPEDFGLVALAMAIIAVLELLGAFSFDVVLIQKQHADRSYYDTAWTFNVIVGALSATVLVLIAKPVALFYGDARLEFIVYMLALVPLINGLQNIGVVEFRKKMQFHKEFKFLLTKKLISFTVTLTLALLLRNYWALIFGVITGNLAGTLLSYRLHVFRPHIALSKRAELFNFSFWMFMTNIVNFVTNRLPDFVVGKIAGVHALGLFSISYEVSNMPTTELVAPINRAVFPGYAMMSNNVAVLREGYLNVTSLIAIFSIPAAFGIAGCASIFVPLVLGDQWLDAVALIEVLAFYGLLNAVDGNTGSVHLAQGRPKINTFVALALNSVRIPALIYGTMTAGILGAAYGILIAGAVMLPINLVIVFRRLEMRTREFLRVFWRPVIAGTLMFFTLMLMKVWLGATTGTANLFLHLMALIVAGAVTYTVVVVILWNLVSRPNGAESAVLNQLLNRIARWRMA